MKLFSIHKDFVFSYSQSGFLDRIFRKKTDHKWQLSISEDCLDKSSGKLEIKEGFTAILGESGCGKSTLLSILSGFEKLDALQQKQISFFPLLGKEQIAKDEFFGHIFQRCYESKTLSAIDNIALPLIIRQHSTDSVKFCKDLLASVNLEELSKKSANELSGGQLTRIGILRGFAQTPKVIFADEPANNLDSQNAKRVLDMLKSWMVKTGGSVIMVTHDVEHAFDFTDHIMVLKSEGRSAGRIVFQKSGKPGGWTSKQQEEIKSYLKSKETFGEFPEPPASVKPNYHQFITFLTKISAKNITSKADGSRTFSFITFLAFFLLFFIFFSANQTVSWFGKIDSLKNDTGFLRQFDIRVLPPHYLSTEIQNTISELKAGDVKKWLLERIAKIVTNIDKNSSDNRFDGPKSGDLEVLQEYERYIGRMISDNRLKNYIDISIKSLKQAERDTKDAIRLSEFLADILAIDNDKKIAEIFPRWDSAPQFVKADGTPMNYTTDLLWLNHRDPLFNDPRMKYIIGQDFRFNSRDDYGIIIDKETLVDDLGYDIDTGEVRIYYDTGEKACIPVRAAVERIPGGSYHAITTLGFGEKIRSSSQHCQNKKKFYQFMLKPGKSADFNALWEKFDQSGENRDQYGNSIINMSAVSDESYEIYCEYKYAKNISQWNKWIREKIGIKDFKPDFQDRWEVVKEREKEPPYRFAVVKAAAKDAVSSLGEFLSCAYREDPIKNWKIEAYGYEEKIRFAKQSETLLYWIKTIGTGLFLGLFLLFLSTNMLINVRNKATEIAIFRAMGGSVLSILYIFNMQIIMILVSAIIASALIVYSILGFGRLIFIENIVYSIWKDIEEQRQAIEAIGKDNLLSVFAVNLDIIMLSIACVIFAASIAILYVRYSDKYAVNKILKER